MTLLRRIQREFAIDWWGHHGVRHWARVRRNGRAIARHVPGIDLAVLDLFAVLHDAARKDEDEDPLHGYRCAARLRKIATPADFRLATEAQYIQLLFAIEHHSEQIKPISPTVAACWNADRLDLGRVGITPDVRFMCPEALPPAHIIHQLHTTAAAERVKQRKFNDPYLLPT
jgi:uncharacterized protein